MAASSVIKSGLNVFIFKLDTTVQPNAITITTGLTGTGIADYGSTTIKLLYKVEDEITPSTDYFEIDFSPAGCTGGVAFARVSYIKVGNLIHFQARITISIATTPAPNPFYNFKIIPPSFAKCKPNLSMLVGINYSAFGDLFMSSDSDGNIITDYNNSDTPRIGGNAHNINLTYPVQ